MRKVCLVLSKRGIAKFISHLDLYRALERGLRRSLLPIVYTQGFNPRPQISFLSALELGATSDCELAVITLREPFPLQEIAERLNRCLPEGIRVEEAFPVEGKIHAEASLFSLRISLPEYASREHLEKAIEEWSKKDVILIERESEKGKKQINLQEYVKDIKVKQTGEREAELEVLISLTPSGSAKPREVISALNLFLPGISLLGVHRKALLTNSP